MTTFVLLSLLTATPAGSVRLAQDPSQPATPAAQVQPAPPAPVEAAPVKGNPTRTVPGFLIIGTVFNERALSLPGVEVRVRQAGQKKHRWQTYTNSRGEFAVRVPEGHEYEVVVRVKKYQELVQKVTAVNGDNQQRLSIKLQPVVDSGKNGAKS